MRIRYLILVLALLLGAHLCPGQTRYTDFEGVEWFSHLWGGSTQRPEFVEVDDSGNVYVAGTFQFVLVIGWPLSEADTLYRPKHWTQNGWPNIFFIKYSPDGEVLWFNTIERPDSSELRFNDFSKCSDGSFVMMGSFADTVVTARGDDLKLQPSGFGNGSNAWGVRLFPDGRLETFFQAWCPGNGVYGAQLRERSDGSYLATLGHWEYPVIIDTDTLVSAQTGNRTFYKSLVNIDKDYRVQQHQEIAFLGGTMVFAKKAEMNLSTGSYYSAHFLANFKHLICEGDTFSGKGLQVLGFDKDLNLTVEKGPFSIDQVYLDLASDRYGNFFLGYSSPTSKLGLNNTKAIIHAFDSIGNALWSKQILGANVQTYAVEIQNDLLYWVGGYSYSFVLENIRYNITAPIYLPNSGYIARLNKNDGKLEWVMSDPDIEEEKWFYAIDIAPDHSMTLIGHFDEYSFTLNGEIMSNFSNGEETDGVIFRMKGVSPPTAPTPPNFEEWFEVWPNPSRGELFIGIHNKISESLELSLWDTKGRKVIELQHSNNNPSQFNLSGIAKGAYLLRLADEKSGSFQTKRIIIQ